MAVSTPFEAAASAVVAGTVRIGEGALLAQGAVVRSLDGGVEIGAGSAVLEHCVALGAPTMPTSIGRRTVFGHRCLVVGAELGDLCEIGNASILMPGARLGDRVFLGEGTLVPSGMTLPDGAVALGRPARVIRRANDDDLARLTRLRGGSLDLPPPSNTTFAHKETLGMGQLYAYRDIFPTVAPSAVLFPSAEITGDVIVGEDSLIGAGVKIIGDSHGPVRIGSRVQILENTVLHLLPDNELIIEDDAVVGPGAMIHGCHIGRGSVVEPAAIVCDGSVVGAESVVRAGACVKQRDRFGERSILDGFPARLVDTLAAPPPVPAWALPRDTLASIRKLER